MIASLTSLSKFQFNSILYNRYSGEIAFTVTQWLQNASQDKSIDMFQTGALSYQPAALFTQVGEFRDAANLRTKVSLRHALMGSSPCRHGATSLFL